VPPLL